MPQTPSAKKDLIRNATRRQRNRARKSAMRTWIKKTVAACEANDSAAAQEGLTQAFKYIDKNTKWNLIHQNTAARRKAKLSRMVAGIQS